MFLLLTFPYSEELAPEMTKDTPLDMSAYRWMFNTCRIPAPKLDFLKKYDPNTSRHIVVMRNGKFYTFDVVNEDGTHFAISDIDKYDFQPNLNGC